MLTEAEIRAMLARAEAATPGPWESHADGCGQVWQKEWPVAFCDTRTMGEGFTKTQLGLNAAFIVAARTDVPALAREVLALREALSALLVALDDLSLPKSSTTEASRGAYTRARKLLKEASDVRS